MADPHDILVVDFLRKVDTDEDATLICEVVDRIANNAATNTKNCTTPLADSFLESLEMDTNKNLQATFKVSTAGGPNWAAQGQLEQKDDIKRLVFKMGN